MFVAFIKSLFGILGRLAASNTILPAVIVIIVSVLASSFNVWSLMEPTNWVSTPAGQAVRAVLMVSHLLATASFLAVYVMGMILRWREKYGYGFAKQFFLVGFGLYSTSESTEPEKVEEQ